MIKAKSFITDLENDILMHSTKLRKESNVKKYVLFALFGPVCVWKLKIWSPKEHLWKKWQPLTDDASNDLNEMGIVSQSIKCYLVTCIDYMDTDRWL